MSSLLADRDLVSGIRVRAPGLAPRVAYTRMSTRRPRPVVAAEVGWASGRAAAGGAAVAAPGTEDGAWRACNMARKAGERASGDEGRPMLGVSLSGGGKQRIKKDYIWPPMELHSVTQPHKKLLHLG